MSLTTHRALIAAMIMAVISGILTVPDLVTQVLDTAEAFVLIFGVLLLFLRVLPVASWSLPKQRIFTWLVAVGICACFTFVLPRAIKGF